MSDCVPGFFGRPHAHRFCARHDERMPARGFKLNGIYEMESVLKAVKDWIYLGDICTRCGEWKPAPRSPQEAGGPQ